MENSLPETKIVKEAKAIVEEIISPAIINHSNRGYLYSKLYAKKFQIKDYDDEGLYLAFLFHDIGLFKRINSRYAFQINSSKQLEQFLIDQQYPKNKINVLIDAVDFHLRLFPQWSRGVEVGLLQIGAWMDVMGFKKGNFKNEIRACEEIYPRMNLNANFNKLFIKSINNLSSCLGLLFPTRYRN
jgi:hypothetical protein